MRNGKSIRNISPQSSLSDISDSLLEMVQNGLRSQLNDFLRNNLSFIEHILKFHSILERNDTQQSAHMRDSFGNNLSFRAQQEIFNNFQRPFNGFYLNIKILEFSDFTRILVSGSFSEPNVARSNNTCFGWHFDHFFLNDWFDLYVVGVGENISKFVFDVREEFGEFWFLVVLLLDFTVRMAFWVVSREDFDGDFGDRIFSDQNDTTFISKSSSGFHDLLSRYEHQPDQNDLVEFTEGF